MADIKKVKIPNASLPAINGETGTYLLRYRMISADKNRYSQWSPVYSIAPDYTYVSGELSNATLGSSIVISWDPVSNGYGNVQGYDVWINWDDTAWEYKQTSRTNSTTIMVPPGTVGYSLRIYAEINPPKELAAHKLYEQLTVTL